MNFPKSLPAIFITAILVGSTALAQSGRQGVPVQRPGFTPPQSQFNRPQQPFNQQQFNQRQPQQQQQSKYRTVNLTEAQRAQPSLGASFYDTGSGVGVRSVFTNSPAQKAGINSGDLISKINGRPIPNAATLNAMLVRMRPGSSIRLTKRNRDGKETEVESQVMTYGAILEASMVPETGAYDNAVLRAEQMLKALQQEIVTAESELDDMKKRYGKQQKQIADLRAKAELENKRAEKMKAAAEAQRKQRMMLLRKRAEAEANRGTGGSGETGGN